MDTEEDGQLISIFQLGSIKYNQILKDHEGTFMVCCYQYGLSVLTCCKWAKLHNRERRRSVQSYP